MCRGALPSDLGHEIGHTIDAVHQQLEVVAGRRIAVQVDGAGVFQHAAHFQQAHGHHAEVGLHSLAVGEAGGLEHLVHGRLLVGDEAHPGHVQIGEGPGVLEGGAGGRAAHRGGVVAVEVEGWAEVDQVNRRGVEAAQNFEVVPGPDGAVGEVGRGHGAQLLRCYCEDTRGSSLSRNSSTSSRALLTFSALFQFS